MKHKDCNCIGCIGLFQVNLTTQANRVILIHMEAYYDR